MDPFGRHELRWFSDGEATALVRDGGLDGQDPPPATQWEGPLQRPAEAAGPGTPDEHGWDGAHYG